MIDFKQKKASSIHYVLLSVLAAVIPSGFYNLEGIIVALLFANWLFFVKGFKALNEIPKGTILLFVFFALFLLGLVHTNNISGQIKFIGRNISYLLIPLSFIGVRLSNEMVSNIKKCFIFSLIACVLFANLYAIIDYFASGEIEIFLTPSVYNKFTYYGLTRVFKNWHPTYVSLFLNISLLFSFYEYYKKKKYIKWSLIGTITIINIFLLNSFIGIIAFSVIFYLFIFQLLYKNIKLLLGTTVLIILIGGLLYMENPFHYPKIEKLKNTTIKITDKKEERNTINLRLAKWKTSIDVFMNAPLLGTSNGDYKNTLYDQYIENDFLYCAEERYSSHNQFLYTLSANGIMGFTIIILILFSPLIRNRSKNIFKLFLIICSIFFITEDILARQQGLVFFVFFYVLLSTTAKNVPLNESNE
ncbi:O-antigen ligase family protein [Flavobacteriaceae bacterium KMM 6898]|nr:O-antigen ligase family protein [Flavobacteriaceae bacterium KMM 6898]